MTEVKIQFKRTGNFDMIGYATVRVENPDDEAEVMLQATSLEFKEFLPINVEMTNDNWVFEKAVMGGD